MEYAPVLIPTLNRHIHLRRCVESLKNNILAKYTDIFISVDFPPSEKYEDGYNQVLEYVKTIDGFKSVNVFYQEVNLGPNKNSGFLFDKIRSLGYSVYLTTEDDNEFSSNYLEYVNRLLKLYRDDDSIFFICTNGVYRGGVKGNYVLRKEYGAYGVAGWLKKYDEYQEWLKNDYEKIHKKFFLTQKLFWTSLYAFYWYSTDLMRECPAFRNERDEIQDIDFVKAIYVCLTGKYSVFSKTRLVRNWGKDGTGVNCERDDAYIPERIKLDPNKRFVLKKSKFIHADARLIQIYSWFSKAPPIKNLLRAILVVNAKHILSEEGFDRFRKKIKKIRIRDRR